MPALVLALALARSLLLVLVLVLLVLVPAWSQVAAIPALIPRPQLQPLPTP
jgi:hypothetical protein